MKAIFAAGAALALGLFPMVALAQDVTITIAANQSGAKNRPRHFRPIRRAPWHGHLRRRVGRAGFAYSQHPGDP
jgi:hypothetical protein